MTNKEILSFLESDWRGKNVYAKLFNHGYISQYNYKIVKGF